jgi:thiol-disulfide isomerase/thioredoxin
MKNTFSFFPGLLLLLTMIGKNNPVPAINHETITASVTTKTPPTGDEFFEKLVAPYKGKVVYIDFWAPWCGPCMGEMPYSQKLQNELEGKEVVFLYIGVSCSKQSWQNTIKEADLKGEHYYANENDGQALSAKFNIVGIPRYVLVDKEGKVKDGDAPRPRDKSKLLKKINELLKK